MGIFGRMKRAVKLKANAAIDKAIDPAKELDMAILELEEQQTNARKELLSYKTSAKRMEQDMATLEEKAKSWEARAMQAVRKGDDELAKQCLKEHKNCVQQAAAVKRDRDEAAGYAIELNRSRKKVETQLQILKLKKGTMATQIAAARSGTGNAFGFDNEAFDKLDRAEEKIDAEAAEAEVEAAMEGDTLGADFDAKLLAAGADPQGDVGADAELARLKARMTEDRERKQLKK
jgi:phage shock protein A